MAPYITLIENRVKERQLIIISKAFTALPLSRMASMLACSIGDAEKGRWARGDAGGGVESLDGFCRSFPDPVDDHEP